MNKAATETSDQALFLSAEETLSLLDIVMTSPAELTAEQRSAIIKLSDFYRSQVRKRALVTLTPGRVEGTSVQCAA